MAMHVTVDTLLDRVKDIAPMLRAHAAEAEAQRQEQLALGETPNIAARIQGTAAANTVVIGHATYRLVSARPAEWRCGPGKAITLKMRAARSK